MSTSIFDLFKIGIGPSSSHTVGPMRAARAFVQMLEDADLLDRVAAVKAELFGSLALTGRGHSTDRAILLGLAGETPDGVDPNAVESILASMRDHGRLALLGRREIPFLESEHLIFHYDQMLPGHSNGMRFSAFDASGEVLRVSAFYSVGGGFITDESGHTLGATEGGAVEIPYPFGSGAELLRLSEEREAAIWQIVLANEKSRRGEDEVRAGISRLWEVMKACVARGLEQEGILPGGLNVRRRAPRLYRKLREGIPGDPLDVMDWVNVFAMAVNEENAAGGRVVTAPTNGAAGIIPAVLHYYERFIPGANEEGVVRFFLTAGAIGILYKENASISGAEVGCQGEVGVACSMAAGGLVAALRGSNDQVENAAEIGMEHNLGMTCDPIGGLVQIPCIERNALGAVKAINAARMALRNDDDHKVSLDQVIKTMYETGLDMQSRYKETSQGGLAANVVEC